MEKIHIERGSFKNHDISHMISKQFNENIILPKFAESLNTNTNSNKLNQFEQNDKFKISHIYKNFFISDILNSNNINELKRLNIKSVLQLGIKKKSSEIIDLYKKFNINYHFLEINDSYTSDISKCFEPAWKIINNSLNKFKNCNILIHCNKGISRSPIIVAYFLTRKMHEKLSDNKNKSVVDDILTLIKMNRPCSNPNKIFIKQLKNYENIVIN
jgi:protein-tyrosine phosphatase